MVGRLGVLMILCAGLAACSEEEVGGESVQDVGHVEPDSGETQPDVEEETELNACGGTAVLTEEPGASCGPCGLDVVQCDGADAVVCDGSTACPDFVVETLAAEDISAQGATFQGKAQALPEEEVVDHGFCVSRGEDEEICRSLGALTQAGDFRFEEDALLPGRNYEVRAYAKVGDKTVYGEAVAFTTAAPEVVGVLASQGEFSEHVRLSWEVIAGAETYVLYRDGQEIARVSEEAAEYLDEQAAAGASSLGAVTGVLASQGDFADHVLVTWEPVETLPGQEHVYQIVAKYPDAESDKTAGVEGYRKAADVGYEISIDGAAFVDAGTQTQYQDFSARAAEITAAEVSASQGTFVDYVALNVEGQPGVETFDTTYKVRAVSVQDVEGERLIGAASEAVQGFRSAGDIALQWESSETVDGTFYAIFGATTPVFHHTSAYSDGSPRFYRARFSGTGTEDVYSEVVEGARAALSIRFVELPRDADVKLPLRVEAEVVNQFGLGFEGINVRMMLARDTYPFFAMSFGNQNTDVQGRAVFTHTTGVPVAGVDYLFEAKLPNNKMYFSEQFRIDSSAIMPASAALDGTAGNGKSTEPALSADGRYVVFTSTSDNLMAGNELNRKQVYRKDVVTGEIKPVSISQSGALGDHDSNGASVSANGQFVAFISTAKNLLASPITSNHPQIYLKDMATGDVMHISTTASHVASDGSCFTPVISADGRFVAFGAAATNLAPGITDAGINHIYRKDRVSGELEPVTQVPGHPAAQWASFEPSISADGSKIAFSSFATNLVAGIPSSPTLERIYVRDMQAGGGFTLVSTNEQGVSADDRATSPSISADGRYVMYLSMATNFAHNANPEGHMHIYRKDLVSGEIAYVSTNGAGEVANQRSVKPAMSADGRYVTFGSYATNLLAGVDTYQMYRKEIATGRVDLVSANLQGEAAEGHKEALNSYTDFPAISADGHYAAFSSPATNLVAGVTVPDQVYVHRIAVE